LSCFSSLLSFRLRC